MFVYTEKQTPAPCRSIQDESSCIDLHGQDKTLLYQLHWESMSPLQWRGAPFPLGRPILKKYVSIIDKSVEQVAYIKPYVNLHEEKKQDNCGKCILN